MVTVESQGQNAIQPARAILRLAPLALLALTLLAAAATATIVAVGYNGVITASTDGSTWSTQTSGTSAALFDVTNNRHDWAVTGSGGTILTSTDPPTATSWTQRTSGTTEWLNAIATNGNTWGAVGTNGVFITSGGPPSWSWTSHTGGPSFTYYGIAAAGNNWRLINQNAIYATSPPSWTLTSQTWTAPGGFSTSNYQLRGIATDGTYWVIVGMDGSGGSGVILTSPNGNTWTSQAVPQPLMRVATYNGNWVAAGPGGVLRASSGPPSWTWTPLTSGSTQDLYGMSACANTPWGTTGNLGTVILSPQPPSWSWASPSGGSGTGQNMRAISCTPPPTTCSPTNPTVLVANTQPLTATGGEAPYTWSAPAASTQSPSNGIGPNLSLTYATAGTYTASVQDGWKYPQTATCTITVANPPMPTCYPATQTVFTGYPATLHAGSGTGTYSWSAPTSNQGTGSGNTFQATYTSPGTYSIQLDDAGPPVQSDQCTVDVQLPPPGCEADPQADFATSTGDATEGQSVSFMDLSTGGTSLWTWDFGDGTNSREQSPNHAYPGPGDYLVRLTASAPYCPGTDAIRALHIHSNNQVNDGGYAPSADAGADQSVPETTTVTLHGSSAPIEGATFTWTQTQGPHVELRNASTPTPTFKAPRTPDNRPIMLAFALRTTDGAHISPLAYTHVTVTPDNHAPVAIADAMREAQAGSTVILDGTTSRDADGDNLTYAWTQTEGPQLGIKDAHSAVASITLPPQTARGQYKFQLQVSDGRDYGTDTTLVIVSALTPAPLVKADAAAPPHVAPNQAAAPQSANLAALDWTGTPALGAAIAVLAAALVLLAILRRRAKKEATQ